MTIAALALLAALATSPPTDVSGVTVAPPGEAPKLVASFPAEGQSVAPGVLVVRITFDQKMLDHTFEIAPAAAGETPDCLRTPRLLNDGKSYVLLCTTLPGKHYALAFNSAPAGGFENTADKRAAPATLSFSTSAADPIRNLPDALKAASLDPTLDVPIERAPAP